MTDIKMKKPSTFRNVAAIKFQLDLKPRTVHELAELVHLTARCVNKYLKVLRDANEVRVCGHEIKERSTLLRPMPIPLYALGDAPDVKYRAQTPKQAGRLGRKRLAADKERHDHRKAVARAKALVPKQQAELAYFFGRAK